MDDEKCLYIAVFDKSWSGVKPMYNQHEVKKLLIEHKIDEWLKLFSVKIYKKIRGAKEGGRMVNEVKFEVKTIVTLKEVKA